MPETSRLPAMPGFLNTPPAMFRTAKATGSKAVVDRTGGKYGAGMISKVSVITAGEAAGHEAWIDETFVDQVNRALAALPDGVKSRWTHPDMSSDGLGKLTSRIMDPEKSADGKQLFANQHFLAIAHRAPDGDLAGYLMDLAEEDPKSYGLSIVFHRDQATMEEFRLAHSTESGEFRSPDKNNVHNYEHIRLGSLEAADAVDSPAANPNGLFSRSKDIAREADAIAMFALGLSSQRPEFTRLGLDPDRVRGFALRFLSTHGLELRTKVQTATAASSLLGASAVQQSTPSRAEIIGFRTKFGDVGAVWYAEGLSMEEAQLRHNRATSDRITAMENQLKAAARVTGETLPAGFCADDDRKGQGSRQGFASKLRFKTSQA